MRKNITSKTSCVTTQPMGKATAAATKNNLRTHLGRHKPIIPGKPASAKTIATVGWCRTHPWRKARKPNKTSQAAENCRNTRDVAFGNSSHFILAFKKSQTTIAPVWRSAFRHFYKERRISLPGHKF